MQTRNVGVDALRVFGILAIVAGHIWTDEITAQIVYPWHVPLFFFLSGYFWKSGRSRRHEARSRWHSLGLPYVCWLLIIAVVFFSVQTLKGGAVPWGHIADAALGGNHIGRPFSAFWFVTALFFLALGYRLLDRFNLVVKFGIAAALLAVSYLIPDQLAFLPFSIGLALPCMIFLVAGEALAKLRGQLDIPLAAGLGGIVFGVSFIQLGLSAPLNLKSIDLGTPAISIVTACALSAGLTLTFEALFSRAGTRTEAAITALSRVGLMVILTHAVLLWLLRSAGEAPWWYLPVAAGVPWAAGLAILRSPLARPLLGVERQHATRAGVGPKPADVDEIRA